MSAFQLMAQSKKHLAIFQKLGINFKKKFTETIKGYLRSNPEMQYVDGRPVTQIKIFQEYANKNYFIDAVIVMSPQKVIFITNFKEVSAQEKFDIIANTDGTIAYTGGFKNNN
jgi:hypothetical protein